MAVPAGIVTTMLSDLPIPGVRLLLADATVKTSACPDVVPVRLGVIFERKRSLVSYQAVVMAATRPLPAFLLQCFVWVDLRS